MSAVAGPNVLRNSMSFYINAVTGGNTLSSVLTGNSLFVNGGSTLGGIINPNYGALVQSQLPLTSSSSFTIAASFNKNNSIGTLFEIRSGDDTFAASGATTESKVTVTNPALSTVGYSPTYGVTGTITESKVTVTNPALSTVGYSPTYGVTGTITESKVTVTNPALSTVGYSPTYGVTGTITESKVIITKPSPSSVSYSLTHGITDTITESKVSNSHPASGTDTIFDLPSKLIEIYTTTGGLVLRIRNANIETTQEYIFTPTINDVATLICNGSLFTLYLNSTSILTDTNVFSLPSKRITLFSRDGKSNFSTSQIRAVQILNTALSSNNIINNAEALRIRG